MTEAYWCCAVCSTIGDCDKTAEAHTRATTHTTLTGTSPDALARMLGTTCVESAS